MCVRACVRACLRACVRACVQYTDCVFITSDVRELVNSPGHLKSATL